MDLKKDLYLVEGLFFTGCVLSFRTDGLSRNLFVKLPVASKCGHVWIQRGRRRSRKSITPSHQTSCILGGSCCQFCSKSHEPYHYFYTTLKIIITYTKIIWPPYFPINAGEQYNIVEVYVFKKGFSTKIKF